MTGGLYDPLGTGRDEPVRGRALPPAPVVALGLMVAALAALLAVSYLRDTGDRGMPVAVARIERLPPPLPPPLPAAAPAQAAPPPALPLVLPVPAPLGQPPRADQDVQIENGVRVVRPRREAPALPPAPAQPHPPAPPTTPPPAQGGTVLRVPEGRPVR